MTTEYSRRDVLRLAALSAAAVACPTVARAEEPKKKIPIALQLWTVRALLPKDFTGTIEAIGKMGYQGVEFAGYYGWDAKPAELRKLLDDNGLKCCGTHTQLPTLLGDNLKKTIELHKILGNKFLICPFMIAADEAAWLDRAKQFNDISARCRESDMFVGYHSHKHDFQKFNGKTSWEIFFDNTVHDVIHQLDTGNCTEGGGDPLAMVKKYPGRTRSTHIKEFPLEAVIGEGTIDWKPLLAADESVGGTEWYIIEHGGGKNPLEVAKASIENLHKLGR